MGGKDPSKKRNEDKDHRQTLADSESPASLEKKRTPTTTEDSSSGTPAASVKSKFDKPAYVKGVDSTDEVITTDLGTSVPPPSTTTATTLAEAVGDDEAPEPLPAFQPTDSLVTATDTSDDVEDPRHVAQYEDERTPQRVVRVRGEAYREGVTSDTLYDEESSSSDEGEEERINEDPIIPIAEAVDESEDDEQQIREDAAAEAMSRLAKDIVVADEDNQGMVRKKRRRWMIGGVIVVAILAIALGIVFGLRVPDDSDPVFVVAENYVCGDAEGPYATGSEVTGNLGALSRSLKGTTTAVSACGSSAATATGLWYVFEGTGSAVKAYTCNTVSADVDTQIAVFAGDCANLRCVNGNDDFCGKNSVASWFAERNQTYYVVVSGKGAVEQDQEFVLNFDQGSANDACATSEGPLVSSEISIQTQLNIADLARPDDSLPTCGPEKEVGLWYAVEGTGKGVKATFCFPETATDPSIAVYEGVHRCDDLTCKTGSFDSINASSGIMCGPRARAAVVSWRSEREKTYYVQVDSTGNNGAVGGGFDIRVEEFETTHDICDEAVRLIPKHTDVTVVRTENATRTGEYPLCGDAVDKVSSEAGVWYEVLGNGDIMQASVCEMTGAVVEVYEKTCEAVSCVEAHLMISPCETRWISDEGSLYYMFVHGADQPYVFSMSLRSFPIALNDFCDDAIALVPDGRVYAGSTANARANDGIFADGNKDAFSGCLFYFPYDNILEFPASVWYSVIGTGNSMTVSTCHEETNFDTQLVVAKGGCSNLECIDTDYVAGRGVQCDVNPDLSLISFSTVKDELYHILVTGRFMNQVIEGSPFTGDFGLSVVEITGPSNDKCKDAEYITPSEGQILFGSTLTAQKDPENPCRPPCTPGVWYTTRGTGAYLQATLLLLHTNFSGSIDVYEGSCDELSPVGERVDVKFLYSIASGNTEWPSEPGRIYYLHVRGVYDQGAFGFELYELKELPVDLSSPGDGCQNAASVQLGASLPTFGSGSETTPGIFSPGCGVSRKSGVWYRLEGKTEGLIYVLTCNPLTETDADISIYAGERCDDLCNSIVSSNLLLFDVAIPGAPECPSGLPGRMVAWNADASTQYYIHVETKEQDGSFVLINFVDQDAPINDSCNKAIVLSPEDGVVSGSTRFGDTDYIGLYRRKCSLTEGAISTGLWYKIKGTGSTMRISTCTNVTTLDTFITVYSGSCDGGSETLLCVDDGVNSNDPLCALSNTSSTVTWASTAGDDYYAFVQSAKGFGTGDFGVFVDVVDEIQFALYQASNQELQQSFIGGSENGRCETAFDIVPSSVITYRGSTVGAGAVTAPSNIDCSYSNPPASPSVWFRVQGTGKGFIVSTCNNGTTYGARFRIYEALGSGQCDNLTCVETMNEVEETFVLTDENTVQWFSTCEATDASTRTSKIRTTAGVIYFILVWGTEDGTVGDYELRVEEIDLSPNDLCADAEYLDFNSSISVQGTTTRATLNDETLVCEPYENIQDLRLDTSGVWYEVGSKGGNAMRVSTCNNLTNFDTKISVYTGESCSNLSCVAWNDDSLFCDGLGSIVSWKTRPLERYFIQVHGYYGAKRLGDFQLTIEEFTVPENSYCQQAPLLQQSSEVVRGSTLNALVENATSFCLLPVGTPGLWYRVSGTGNSLRATTCTNETTFDTRLAVYSGNDCERLSCIDANGDSGAICPINGDASTVPWKTNVGETYYIHVYGAPGASGDFGLVLEEADVPENDGCVAASTVPTWPLFGTTEKATDDTFAPECGTAGVRAPGTWFSVQGTGARTVVSVCNDGTSFVPDISVYKGPCYRLDCVDTLLEPSQCDSGSSEGWSVSWATDPAEQYNLLVHGSGNETGNFSISVVDVDPPINDACTSAATIVLSEGEVTTATGSTWAAYPGVNATLCVPGEITGQRGIWYRVDDVRPGKGLLLSTCSGSTNFDARISVYRGECGALNCVDTILDDTDCGKGQSLHFIASKQGSYYLFIHGATAPETGTFELAVKEFDAPSNDVCGQAEPIVVGETVLGSTRFAQKTLDLPFCGVSVESPGIWYSFSVLGSEGFTVRATVRGLDKVTVFSGSCGSLACVAGEEYRSPVAWMAQAGETYSILVHGQDGDVGDFELSLVLLDDAGCEGATDVEVSGSVVRDMSLSNVIRRVPFCVSNVHGASEWFRVIGTGSALQVSSCSENTDFDTVINVYTGSCGTLTCVGGNDDGGSCTVTTGASLVKWASEPSTEYFLVVHGYKGAVGNFGILVSEAD